MRGCADPGVIGFCPPLVRISETGMGLYPPVVALPLCASPSQSGVSQHGWGFHAVRGGVDPGDRNRSRVFGAVDIRGIYELRIAPYRPRVRRNCPSLMDLYPPRTALWSSNPSRNSQRDRGFLTVRGGVDPRKLRFLLPLVEGLQILND